MENSKSNVIESPTPSSGSMLGEQDQEMMGDRVPGDQMVLGHDADKEGRDKSSLTNVLKNKDLYDSESSVEDLPDIPRHTKSDSNNEDSNGNEGERLLGELRLNVGNEDGGTPVVIVDEEPLVEDAEAVGEKPAKRRRKTKKLKKEEMINERARKIEKYKKAKEDMKVEKFDSLRECARHHDVSEATLRRLLKTGKEFKGQRSSSVLRTDEQCKLVAHVKMMATRG